MTSNGEHHSMKNGSDLQEIREITSIVDGLIAMMSAGNIGVLKLEYGSLRLSLRSREVKPRSIDTTPARTETPATHDKTIEESLADGADHIITAPMIGTFYAAPAPNEPPYVLPGDDVSEGQTIGIIEAMKIMNEIAADRAGTIVEIMATNGQTVEYGSPLLRIMPAVT